MTGEYVKMPAQQSWQCPICGRIYLPTMMICLDCCNEKESISTTYTIDYVHHEGITKTEGE